MPSQANVDVVSKEADSCHNHMGTASALWIVAPDSEEGVIACAECCRDSALRQRVGSKLFSTDAWQRRAFRVSSLPRIGPELFQQNCTLDNVMAVVGPEQSEEDKAKVGGLEHRDSEDLESYRPNTGDVSKSKA